MEECGICGLELNDKFSHTLSCNHIFHYECLMKSFQSIHKHKKEYNHCPYCREKYEYLPLINGLKKVIPGVHCNTFGSNESKALLKSDYSKRCEFILTRGKNKGSVCNKTCSLGYTYCKTHCIKVNKDKNKSAANETIIETITETNET